MENILEKERLKQEIYNFSDIIKSKSDEIISELEKNTGVRNSMEIDLGNDVKMNLEFTIIRCMDFQFVVEKQ